jgi:DNA-directed RNA polymerase specialized sigma24 family protein
MKELIEKAITGSKTAEEKLNHRLYERFFHLAQNILRDDGAAKLVAKNALKVFKYQYENALTQDALVHFIHDILDEEIDHYFQELLGDIRKGSEKAENILMNIMNKRFIRITQKRVQYDECLNDDDAKDIVQNALKTVSEKCRDAEPRGTFIQWAQTVLKNKYMEYRKARYRDGQRIHGLSDDGYESGNLKKMNGVLYRKRSVKEVSLSEIETHEYKSSDSADNDVIECDPYRWGPIVWVEYTDLKNSLLSLMEKMDKRCRKVFEVLLTERHVKFVNRAFPNMTRNQIDVIISRCRKKLKKKVQTLGVLF